MHVYCPCIHIKKLLSINSALYKILGIRHILIHKHTSGKSDNESCICLSYFYSCTILRFNKSSNILFNDWTKRVYSYTMLKINIYKMLHPL